MLATLTLFQDYGLTIIRPELDSTDAILTGNDPMDAEQVGSYSPDCRICPSELSGGGIIAGATENTRVLLA